MIADPLLLLEAYSAPEPDDPAGGAGSGVLVVEGDAWPGVADPDTLRGRLLDWLSQYDNAGTRRTYAYALGLPIDWVDAIGSPSA